MAAIRGGAPLKPTSLPQSPVQVGKPAGVGKAADAASSAATAGGGGASDGSATAGTDVMSQIMAEVGRRRNSIVSRTGGDDSDEWDE